MQVKSFGCSFIFGSELADEESARQEHSKQAVPSELTWPAHVSNHLNSKYYCHARPGSGNLQIMERVLSHAVDPVSALYVIGWTWIDRFDYTPSTINRYGTFKFWRTLMPIDETETAKIYYKDLHSEFRDKLNTLTCMRLTIDFLRERNQPFIMTYMDNLTFDNQWNTTPAIAELQNYVKPYMTTFEGLNLQEWSKKNKYPIANIGHPLEQAHRSAGDYIIQAFDKKSIGAHCHLV